MKYINGFINLIDSYDIYKIYKHINKENSFSLTRRALGRVVYVINTPLSSLLIPILIIYQGYNLLKQRRAIRGVIIKSTQQQNKFSINIFIIGMKIYKLLF